MYKRLGTGVPNSHKAMNKFYRKTQSRKMKHAASGTILSPIQFYKKSAMTTK